MARKVFFSFHYERTSATSGAPTWFVTAPSSKAPLPPGFMTSLWEEAKRKGDAEVKRLIDQELVGTSVTVVLIGAQTAERKIVDYEIEKSIARGNGLLGIYISGIKDQNGHLDAQGCRVTLAGC